MDNRIKRTGWVLTTVALSCGIPLQAQPQPQVQAQPQAQVQPQGAIGPWTELLAPQREDRYKAFWEVSRRHGEMVNGLTANLKAITSHPGGISHDFDGPFHLTVIAIRNLRAETAAMQVASKIDFRLDPATQPAGARAGASSYYPVAETLARIGGQRVVRGVLAQLVLPRSDEFVRASSWVLQEILGKEVALLLVQQRFDRTSATLAKLGTRTTNPETENLQRVMQLITTGGQILVRPDRNQNSVTTNRTRRSGG